MLERFVIIAGTHVFEVENAIGGFYFVLAEAVYEFGDELRAICPNDTYL